MRILFLLPDFPHPASTGGRLKVFNVLKQMSVRHQCDILSFGEFTAKNIADLNALLPNVLVLGGDFPARGIKKWFWMLWNIARGLPPSFAQFRTKKYIELLKRCLVENVYDVVHYDVINMAQYLEFGVGIPSVHSPNDATSLIYSKMAADVPWSLEKIKLLISATLLRRYEREHYRQFSKVHVVSQDDAAYLRGLVAGVDVATIPIAVDDAFTGGVDLLNSKNQPQARAPKIVCNGNLGNPAIARGVRDFLSVAFPLVLKKWPTAQFVMLGQNASSALHDQLKASPNTEFLTWVDDYRAFVAGADVVLVPDLVGPPGAKTRTIQAMALGQTVVGTQTAFAGIPFVNNEHGFLYKTMPECAALIVSIVNDKRMRSAIGENAHRLVVDHYSLSVVGIQYEEMYHDAVSGFYERRSQTGQTRIASHG